MLCKKMWYNVEKMGIAFGKIYALRYSCGGIVEESAETRIPIGKLFIAHSHIPRLHCLLLIYIQYDAIVLIINTLIA